MACACGCTKAGVITPPMCSIAVGRSPVCTTGRFLLSLSTNDRNVLHYIPYLSYFNGFCEMGLVGRFFCHHAMAVRKPNIIVWPLLLQMGQFEVSINYQAPGEHRPVNCELAKWLVNVQNHTD